VARPAGKAPAPKGGADTGDQPAAKTEKAIEYDEVAYNRAKAYVTAHPGDIRGSAVRFETVAACYPGSKWAEKSLQEAKQIRAKLEAQRTSQQPLIMRVEKLELAEVLATLDKDSAAKKDIEVLQDMFNRVHHRICVRPRGATGASWRRGSDEA
jgi:hypothetical protein